MCDDERCDLANDECTCWCKCGFPHDQCQCNWMSWDYVTSKDYDKAKKHAKDKILDWLLNDERVGLSSEALCRYFLYGEENKHWRYAVSNNYPRDNSDISRCVNLIEKVPEIKLCLLSIRDVNPQWNEAVDKIIDGI